MCWWLITCMQIVFIIYVQALHNIVQIHNIMWNIPHIQTECYGVSLLERQPPGRIGRLLTIVGDIQIWWYFVEVLEMFRESPKAYLMKIINLNVRTLKHGGLQWKFLYMIVVCIWWVAKWEGWRCFAPLYPKEVLGDQDATFLATPTSLYENSLKESWRKRILGRKESQVAWNLYLEIFIFIFWFQTKLLPHACFNAFIMVPNICAQHVHGYFNLHSRT